MITSKLTSKAQTTIPQPVRRELNLKEGDEIAYVIEGGRVFLTKAEPDDGWTAFGLAVFAEEWDGEEDRKLYANL